MISAAKCGLIIFLCLSLTRDTAEDGFEKLSYKDWPDINLNGTNVKNKGNVHLCKNSTLEDTKLEEPFEMVEKGTSKEHHIVKRFLWFIAVAAVVTVITDCFTFCREEQTHSNNPPRLVCPESGQEIYAPRLQTGEYHYWPDPTATDDEDGFIPRDKIKLESGSDSGSYFEKGWHEVRYSVKDTNGLQSTCAFTFTIKVITCQPIKKPKHGELQCDTEFEFIYGSSCLITCNDGYEMDSLANNNQQRITCEISASVGIYSEQPKDCKAIKCHKEDSALKPKNGIAVCTTSDYSYQTTCYTRCDDGYSNFEDQKTTECLSNKQWSHVLPGCKDTQRPEIQNCPEDIFKYAERNGQPVNISWEIPRATDNSEEATIIQVEGSYPSSFFPVGIHKIVYSATDADGNISPNCVFYIRIQELMCTPPVLTDRYMIQDCSNGYSYGSNCSLSCMGGFPLIGNDTITCEKTENDSIKPTYWNVGTYNPYCKTNPCEPLLPPVNGAISCAEWLFGQICTMQCQESFDIPYGTKSSENTDFDGKFVCSTKTGKYYPTDIVPNCTETRNVQFSSLPSEYFYYSTLGTINVTLNQIKKNFIFVMQQLEQSGWAGVCPNTTECNVDNVDVTFGPSTGRRRRSVAYEDIEIEKRSTVEIRVSFQVKTDWQNSTPSLDTFLEMEALQKRIFEVIKLSAERGDLAIGGLSLDLNSFTSNVSEPNCPDGTAIKLESLTCVPCPVGTYLDKSNTLKPKCKICPRGTFKDKEDGTVCTICPNGTFTLTDGAESASECIETCSEGEFSDTGLKPCNICPRGRFQNNKMSTTCEKCPTGTYSKPMSVSSGSCTEFDITFAKTGDSVEFVKSIVNESKQLALFTWIKMSNASFTIFNEHSGSVSITYGTKIVFNFTGSILSINNNADIRKWHHLGIIIDVDANIIRVYINGSLYAKETMPVLIIDNLINANVTVNAFLSEDFQAGEVSITGYQIATSIPDERDILNVALSCQAKRNDTVLSMSDIDMDQLHQSRVQLPSFCDSVDQCVPDPCNGHACIDREFNYACHCGNGYSGVNCEIPPDFCSTLPCKNGGLCQNENGHYNCSCLGSFKGKNCESAIVNGRWSNWSEFSKCSVTCGGGVKFRSRICNNPPPDSDGLQCDPTKSTESMACNVKDCPSCPVLVRSFGNMLNCSERNEHLVCEVGCSPGYSFVQNNLPLKEYKCGPSTGYTWNGLTPACGKTTLPNHLSSSTTIQYNSGIPCNETSTAINAVRKNLNALQCHSDENCDLSINVQDCKTPHQSNRSASSISVTLSSGLPEGDLDLQSFIENGKMSPSLQILVNTVVKLENSTKILNDTVDSLTFDIVGVTYSPTGSESRAVVDCKAGQGMELMICIDCPMGTYSVSGRCLLCEKGTYQDEIGQTVCKLCPTDKTTEFVGSQDVSNCTEAVYNLKNTTESIKKIEESDFTLMLAIFIPVAVVFIGVTFAFLFCCNRNLAKHSPTRKRKYWLAGKSKICLGNICGDVTPDSHHQGESS